MKLFRNWTVHNLISHPLSELVFLAVAPFSRRLADKWSGAVHNFTLPMEFEGNGRG